MARGTDVRLGPWPDGINLLDKPDQLQDTQLVDCLNFDIDNTGVLEPRRGIRSIINGGSGTAYLCGTLILDAEVQPRAIVNTYFTDVNLSVFRGYANPEDSPVTISDSITGFYRSVVQYQGKIWYIPGNAGSVGKSSPSTSSATLTSVASMPYGDYGFILKDRLFIVRKESSELYFSAATAFAPTGSIPTPWDAPDGGVIQVNPGDNNPITKVVVVNNQIVIFKRDQTYVLSFSNSPTGDGVLRQVSPDQGALDAITYNNEVYCYNARSVFKFVNGFFQDIGLQLALPNNDTIDNTALNPARINVVGKTLIFGTTPSGKTYAMNLDTGSWTTYSLPLANSLSSGTIFSRSPVGTAIFFGDGSNIISYMLVKRDFYTDRVAGAHQAPEYFFRTKEYNFDDSEAWKRMYAWHLDSEFSTTLSGSALTFINGVQNNNSVDVLGLVGSSLSYRFKTSSLGYWVASFASTANVKTAPIIRGIRAVIGAKAPTSK